MGALAEHFSPSDSRLGGRCVCPSRVSRSLALLMDSRPQERALFEALCPPEQKPWDFVFGQRNPYWIIVHLKDLRKIAGVYGGRSFASSNPAPPQIYLEEVWELDEAGHFIRAVEESEGILILESEILAVELFRYTRDR